MINNIIIRRLEQDEEIPYDLLLLADETRGAINKYIHASEIYIAEAGNRSVGVYALFPVSTEKIEIKNIAVIPELQGKGIGKILLNDAENRAKASGYRVLLIATADAGIRQLQLYQRCGFEMHEIRRNFFMENYPKPIFENGILLKH